jgi:dipeptidyl aminopeptidase/acylaminoacyl peptidase
MNRRLALIALLMASTAGAQVATTTPDSTRGRGRGGGRGQQREMWRTAADTQRAKQLYVSKDTADLPRLDSAGYVRNAEDRARIEAAFEKFSRGVMQFEKVSYRSDADGLEIPAYVFSPLNKRGARGHAAMVWVHGGVHSDMQETYLPFIREAVQRGYVIVTPDYRGSTGHGKELYEAIDYGGKEIDDVISAVDYLKTLPYVDMNRLGIMGWSHGGFITAHSLFRDDNPFKAGAAIVPVTNLVFRLSYKGPGYQRSYSTEEGIQGLPFEKPDEYIRRSPVFHASNLKVPILVHVATNDEDVNFVEDQQMVYTLRALKPDLAETKIYENPAPWGSSVGHAFSRRVDPVTLERVDSPAQIDSWNRTWTFFEWNLRPYEDRSKPAPPVRTGP